MTVNQGIPSGWAMTTLSAIATWGSGGTPSRSSKQLYGGPIPWLKTGELGPKTVYRSEESITEEALKVSSAKLFPIGSIALAMYGATIGKVSILGIPAATNQACAVGQPNPLATSSEFLYNYLLSQKDAFVAAGQGGAQPNISQGVVKGWPMPLPPLAEQQRIADKLDTVLARVVAVNARLARVAPLLKRFRQSVLAAATSGRLTADWRDAQHGLPEAVVLKVALASDHEAAGGHERGNASEPTKEAHDLTVEQLPAGWQVCTLKDCCAPGRPITYGILKPGPELEKGVPYIRVADFPRNRLNLAGIKKTSPEIDLQYKRARLIGGDLLLSIRGSVGRLIEIPSALEGANITQDTARLSLSRRLSSKYVHFALLAPDTQRRMSNAIRGVAVRGINIGDVRALQVPLPSLLEQIEIVRRVELLLAFAERLEARLQAAQTATSRLTPSLLAKAFRGELVPQDPNDEPVAELLRRLAQNKSDTTPRGRKPRAKQAT